MTQHAKLSPSASSRWMACPGSIRLCANIPRKPTSKYAAEGSFAHFIAELCLKQNRPPSAYLGRDGGYHKGECFIDWIPEQLKGRRGTIQRFQVTQEMVDALDVYVNEVLRVRKDMVGASFHVEKKLDLTWLVPDMFGTGDHVAEEPLNLLDINDLKYGAGIAVDIKGNTQLMIYALGAIGEGNPNMIEDVSMCISQPRAFHPDGPIRRHTMPAEELIDWGYNVLKPAALATQKPDAPLKRGEWCKKTWCPANDIDWCHKHNVAPCPLVQAELQEGSDAVFGSVVVPVEAPPTLPVVENLTAEQIDKVIPFIKAFKAWGDEVEKMALTRLRTGHPDAPTQFKRVQGRGSRKFVDEAKAVADITALAGEQCAYQPRKPATPAQVEKAIQTALNVKPKQAKEMIQHLVETTYGESMVHVSDKKPALPPVADSVFGNVEV